MPNLRANQTTERNLPGTLTLHISPVSEQDFSLMLYLGIPHWKLFLLHDPYLPGALHCCDNAHKGDQITVCQACAGRHFHGCLLIPHIQLPSSVTLLLGSSVRLIMSVHTCLFYWGFGDKRVRGLLVGPELPKDINKNLCDSLLFDIAERAESSKYAPRVGTKEMAARRLSAGRSSVPRDGCDSRQEGFSESHSSDNMTKRFL